jgi:hypothetical protein
VLDWKFNPLLQRVQIYEEDFLVELPRLRNCSGEYVKLPLAQNQRFDVAVVLDGERLNGNFGKTYRFLSKYVIRH